MNKLKQRSRWDQNGSEDENNAAMRIAKEQNVQPLSTNFGECPQNEQMKTMLHFLNKFIFCNN